MLLIENDSIKLLGYSNENKESLILQYRCKDCQSVGERKIYKNKITNIYCKCCHNRWCFIPIENGEISGKLVDYRIEAYNKLYKIIKDKKFGEWLKGITDEDKKDKLILDLLRTYYIINNK